MAMARVGIIGDFSPGYMSHRETNQALEATATRLGVELAYSWMGTDEIDARGTGILAPFDGFWAAPGSPYRSLDAALAGIRFARESGRPFVGT